jgi:glycosyltransferase involved in cell wall biosynthesis
LNTDLIIIEPEFSEPHPELSIVIPAANEQKTIREFIDWCKKGIQEAQVSAEIIIVSSSSDNTGKIARECGARVIETPRRGLGRAYIDSLNFIKGKYVLLGDADCTYDFRELSLFLTKFRSGYDFIMGSRYKGSIEKGAMPFMHQYIGTPITTYILNKLFNTNFSDIHCGMRGITKKAFEKINLQSQSWEYASEMVIKARQHNLRIEEVPVKFYKDINGRQSHHKRSGFLSPYKAAFINIRAMLIYGSEYVLRKIGNVLSILGILPLLLLTFGPKRLGNYEFNITAQVIGAFLFLAGIQFILISQISRQIHDYSGSDIRKNSLLSNYNFAFLISLGIFTLGIILILPFFIAVIKQSYVIPEKEHLLNVGILGFTLIFLAIEYFTSLLVLLGVKHRI